MEPEAPEIDSIEIIELLGKGGMSLVYRARQKQLDRIVAVKVLSKLAVHGEDGIKRFQKEAKLTSTLDHPNIVKTISFGVSNDGQPYLVMEYLEGLSLADDLKQNGRLKLQKFKDVFLPTLSALNLAHQAGLIHRDIKPGNIMICKSATGAETVKLVDFGIAKVFAERESESQNLTKTGAVMGSPAYMSPEQCLGKTLDGRSDLYSMACVMFETLSGEPPFLGESSLDVMQKHSAEPPPTVSDLSRKIDIRKELAKVTLWGLAKDPAARPQTASEFARRLNEVLERITLDKVPRLKTAANQQFSRVWIIAATIACFSGFACLFSIYVTFKNDQRIKKLETQRNEHEWSIKMECLRFYEKGKKNFEEKNMQEAEICLYRALRLAQAKDKHPRLSSEQLIEIVYKLSFMPSAKRSPDELVDLLESVEPNGNTHDGTYNGALKRLGETERELGNYKLAVALHLKALRYTQQHTKKFDISEIKDCQQQLAWDYVESANYSEARAVMQKMSNAMRDLPKDSNPFLRGKWDLWRLYDTMAKRSGDPGDQLQSISLLEDLSRFHLQDPETAKLCQSAREELRKLRPRGSRADQ